MAIRYPAPLRADRTAVIVPLVAADPAGLAAQCAQVAALPAETVDLVEWRLDRDHEVRASGDFAPGLAAIRAALPDIPVLGTYRTAAEERRAASETGQPDAPEAYADLVRRMAVAGFSLVDVERTHPECPRAVGALKEHGTPVLLSEHHFEGPLDAAAVAQTFAAMEAAGADVAKLAVTPRLATDVTALMDATAQAAAAARVPLIAIAMGALGRITRVGAPAFGSAASYCSVGEGSAPGQVPAVAARQVLDLLAPESP